MSIEVEVFPTQFREFSLAQVEGEMRNMASYRPNLNVTADDQLLTTNVEGITTIDRGVMYFVPFGCRSLTLSIWDVDGSELDHFRDHIRNIPTDQFKSIALKNAEIGVYFNIDSKMARGPLETSMMLLLAATLAKLTDGLIVLPDHSVENVPQGGYQWYEIMELFKKYGRHPIEPIVTRELKVDID